MRCNHTMKGIAMNNNKCIVCGSKMTPSKSTRPKLYCSGKCNAKAQYRKNPRKFIERALAYQKSRPKTEKKKAYEREYMKKWREENREHHNELMYKQYRANRKAWNARSWAAQNITLTGKSCTKCFSEENLERHHPDYDKPLEVVILCRSCHREHHKKERENKK